MQREMIRMGVEAGADEDLRWIQLRLQVGQPVHELAVVLLKRSVRQAQEAHVCGVDAQCPAGGQRLLLSHRHHLGFVSPEPVRERSIRRHHDHHPRACRAAGRDRPATAERLVVRVRSQDEAQPRIRPASPGREDGGAPRDPYDRASKQPTASAANTTTVRGGVRHGGHERIRAVRDAVLRLHPNKLPELTSGGHRMRIVQVVSTLSWDGGVQEHVGGLSRALRDAGHEVVILTGGRPPPEGPAPHALTAGLDVRYHPKRRIARRYLYPTGLWSSLRGLRSWADVVHVHQPFFVGTWIAAATRAPLVATLHLHPEHLEAARRRRLLNLLLRRPDLVVADSDAELGLIRSVRSPRRSAVVWPSLWTRPDPRTTAGQRPLVLSVGRLATTKGLDTTLRALSHLPDDVELAVVGGGPEAARCRSLCAELGMDADEVLRGDSLSDREVDLLMGRAAVFISASRQEAFGIAPMKALAHGARVVLSDIPSHREIVITVGADDELLFDPDIEPGDLAALVMSALASPPPAPEVAARVPTWHDSARRMVDHYGSMLDDRRRLRWRSRQRRPESSSTSR